MTLQLDNRQRAMLAEMGVRLFDAPARTVVPVAPVAPVAAHAPDLIAEKVQAAPAGGQLDAETSARTALAPAGHAHGIGNLSWEALAETVAACRACGLCQGRRNAVFGAGDPQADWLVVGEAPGEGEDLQGEPFVGQDGHLLDNMLKALRLDRRKVYITNVLKCRPPGNRNPEPSEVAQCEPFLRRQVALLQPKVILAMGRFAVQSLLRTAEPIGRLRGRVHRYEGVPVVVTYHPAYLLRNLPDKARAWADLCLAMDVLEGRGVPGDQAAGSGL